MLVFKSSASGAAALASHHASQLWRRMRNALASSSVRSSPPSGSGMGTENGADDDTTQLHATKTAQQLKAEAANYVGM
jgi:hypothetical protein